MTHLVPPQKEEPLVERMHYALRLLFIQGILTEAQFRQLYMKLRKRARKEGAE